MDTVMSQKSSEKEIFNTDLAADSILLALFRGEHLRFYQKLFLDFGQ